jgi:hypothetical protein
MNIRPTGTVAPQLGCPALEGIHGRLNLGGSASGNNRLKRTLVRSVTEVGTMAAYLVGGPGGFAGLNEQLDNSISGRERIASNTGLAGEREINSLAFNENIAVTLARNTADAV